PRGLVGPQRSRRSVRLPRLGRIVTPGRAGGLLGMLVAGFLYSFATGPTAFGLSATRLPELRWTDASTVRATLGLADGANVFRIDTGPLESALEALPAVASARVDVLLPDAEVVVSIEEREAILAWEAGSMRYLADHEGVLFAAVPKDERLPAGLVVVEDRRLGAADAFAIGDRLDTTDLDVATRLGSLTPADVGSAASRLRVRVTEGDGFVLVTDGGWVAVFGVYSPATRPADMIAGQARLLRSILYGREDQLARIVLASETSGTYVPKPSPRATPR
ncbi:MAG TPA: FtsQ-type POTRA domain-containing protein, partial [Candidatus Binatia bacterium]|nr:FtsQ-type POTRA domain-containing protein [Candidatus Binatia bacterium]